MSEVKVTVLGCDDWTTVTMNVDEQGMAVLLLLAALTKQESEYGCQPVVRIEEATDE